MERRWNAKGSHNRPYDNPALLKHFDAVVYESEHIREDGSVQRPSFVLIKKFEGSGGSQNMLAMTIDGGSIGPITSHVKGFTFNWMRNKKLVLTNEGELYDSARNNSASPNRQSGDNAESNSPERKRIVPREGVSVNTGSDWSLPRTNGMHGVGRWDEDRTWMGPDDTRPDGIDGTNAALSVA